jgi:hypothetical protein
MDDRRMKLTIKPDKEEIQESFKDLTKSVPLYLTAACTVHENLNFINFISEWSGGNTLSFLNVSNLEEKFTVNIPTSPEMDEYVDRIVGSFLSFLEDRDEDNEISVDHLVIELVTSNTKLSEITKKWNS